PHAVAEGQDGQVGTGADHVHPGAADGYVRLGPVGGGGVRGGPAAVAGFVKVTGVVQGDGLQEHPDGPVDQGGREQGSEQGGGVVGARRARDDQSGDVPQHGDTVVVVEVAAETFLVREPGDAQHQRV